MSTETTNRVIKSTYLQDEQDDNVLSDLDNEMEDEMYLRSEVGVSNLKKIEEEVLAGKVVHGVNNFFLKLRKLINKREEIVF